MGSTSSRISSAPQGSLDEPCAQNYAEPAATSEEESLDAAEGITSYSDWLALLEAGKESELRRCEDPTMTTQ